VLFHEYFHGDNGRGVGADHQTGWTALVAPCIEDLAHRHAAGRPAHDDMLHTRRRPIPAAKSP
jgi:hypothetical protein